MRFEHYIQMTDAERAFEHELEREKFINIVMTCQAAGAVLRITAEQPDEVAI